MIIIMTSCSKIFVALLMLCYIATTSIAAVHAFPSMVSSDSKQSRLLFAKQSISTEVDLIADTVMPCHQRSGFAAKSTADDAKASSACKIFCSAIGHALLSFNMPEMVLKLEQPSPSSSIHQLLTRQTSVDHQPPK